jgi:hypothetical protein
MDTGIGRTSYSIMAQGQIDQILSSKPEERRAVFEEAAGITKYKSQRREAMNKLALTDQNLARVADVIGEVGRQIGSLRRQAAKAMRYKRLSFRLRHLSSPPAAGSTRSSAPRWANSRPVAACAPRPTRAARSLEAQQAALEAKSTERSRLNQRVQDAQQAVFDVRSAEGAGRERRQPRRHQAHGLEDRLEASRTSLGEVEMQIREVSAQVDSGAQDKQLQLNLLGSSDAVFQQRNRELAIAEGELSKLEQELSRRSSSCSSSRARWRACAPTAPATRSTRKPPSTGTTRSRRSSPPCASSTPPPPRPPGTGGARRGGAGREGARPGRGHRRPADHRRPHPRISRRAAQAAGHRPPARPAHRAVEAAPAVAGKLGRLRRRRQGPHAGPARRQAVGEAKAPPSPHASK